MRIAVVFTASHFNPRFRKIADTLRKAGHDLVLIGLDRQPDAKVPDPPPGVVIRLLKQPARPGGAFLRAVPAFTRHVARHLRDTKPDLLYCINEEAVIFVLAARLVGCRTPPIVCDLFDSLALRLSGSLRLVARPAASLALSLSQHIIVTDENRRGLLAPRFLPRVSVLPNYPRQSDAAVTGAFPSGPTRILVAGELTWRRGLGQLLEACQGLDRIELWCAGPAAEPWFREVFLRAPLTRYFGVLPQSEVLALSEACDGVFCFYDPDTPNNVNASPSKVYDSMMVGRPVIINKEIRVADFVAANELGYVVGYHDTNGLRSVLRSLPDARRDLPAFARRAVALSQTGYCWEAVESRLIAALAAASGVAPELGGITSVIARSA